MDRFASHLEHIKTRDSKLKEHLSLRDDQEREKLKLDRQRAAGEDDRYRHELKMEEQKHEIQRTQHFIKLLETPNRKVDSVGEAIFGHTDWQDKKKVILAMIVAEDW